jgi:hypothetical protein
MTKADKVDTFRLIFKKEIFALYKSGDKVTQKSPLLGRLLVVILLLTAVYMYYKYVTGNMRDKATAPSTTTVSHVIKNDNASSTKALTFDDNTIVVPIHCRYDYCDSKFFKRLPYGVLERYKDDIYKLVFYHKLKYSTDIYIETTEHNMKIFSTFSSSIKDAKGKSIVGDFMES